MTLPGSACTARAACVLWPSREVPAWWADRASHARLQLPARRHVRRLVAELGRLYRAADADDHAAAFSACEARGGSCAQVEEPAAATLLTHTLRRSLGDAGRQRRAHWLRAIGASVRSARKFGTLAEALWGEARALERLAQEVVRHDSHVSLGAVRAGVGADAATEAAVKSERRKRQAALDAIGMRWIGECLNEVIQLVAAARATAAACIRWKAGGSQPNAGFHKRAVVAQVRLSHAEIGAQIFAVTEQVASSVYGAPTTMPHASCLVQPLRPRQSCSCTGGGTRGMGAGSAQLCVWPCK